MAGTLANQYQYLATLESHTCDQCAHLDERIFYVKDRVEGLNYPLIHPYCRCTTVPYIKDLPDIESRWYRDPVTGKGKWTNGKMSYSEWAKAFNIKPLNKKKFIEAKPKVSRLQGPKLTEPEERAINNYVSSDSYKLNSALRSDRPLTAKSGKIKTKSR